MLWSAPDEKLRQIPSATNQATWRRLTCAAKAEQRLKGGHRGLPAGVPKHELIEIDWQQLVALAHNLLTNFQIDTGAPERTRSRKHTVLHLLRTLQTLRFEIFHRAALLVRPGGTTQLRLTNNAATR